MSLRLLLWPALLLSTSLLIAGCNSGQRDLKRAAAVEKQGSCKAALPLYDRAIAKLSSRHFALRSKAYERLAACLWNLERLNDSFAAYQKAVESDAENLDARLKMAELMVAGGVPTLASSHAEFILQRRPGDAGALSVLGSVEASAGRTDKAEMLYRQSLRTDPSRAETAIALAELLLASSRTSDARALLLQAAADSQPDPSAWLALGRMEEQLGVQAAAEAAYRKAIQTQDSVTTNMRFAQFLQRSGRISEAEDYLKKVDERQPASTAAADFKLVSGRSYPAFADYLSKLLGLANADSNQKSGVVARAVEAQLKAASGADDVNIRNAAKVLEQHGESLPESVAKVLEAEIALAQANLERAAEVLDELESQQPADVSVKYLRGVLKQRLGESATARSEWQATLALDPQHVPARLMMAYSLLQNADAATAEEHVASVVRDEPANMEALSIYARVLTAQRRFGEAASIALRALAVQPSSALPHILLGDIAFGQGRLAAALVEFRKATVIDPKSTEALRGLIRVYRHGKFTRSMLRQMERAAEAPPSSAALYEIAGRLYIENGWSQDALRALRRSVELDSQRMTALLALSRAHTSMGEQKRALEFVAASRLQGADPATTALLSAFEAGTSDARAAIRHYELALKRGENSGVTANNLAWLYASRGEKLDRALMLAEAAVTRNPEQAAMADTLGFVHLRLGNYSAAVGVLRHAASLSREPAERAQIQARLTEAMRAAGLVHDTGAVSR